MTVQIINKVGKDAVRCLLLLTLVKSLLLPKRVSNALFITKQYHIVPSDRVLDNSSQLYRRTNLSMSNAVGFIGLGIMGEGMAGRLLSQGIAGTPDKPLIIWNRTGQKCLDFKEKYSDKNVEIKQSAKDVVESSEICFSMLSTPEASRAVFEAKDGVLAGVNEGKYIVDCATLAEKDMKSMNEAVKGKGGHFLEAPVSGSKVPAANGQLIFLCAGSQDLFNKIVDDSLKAMGKESYFFNTEVGFGTRAKLVVNSLMGTMVAAFGEGLALSENVGLDPLKIIQVINGGAIQSPVYGLKGPKMVAKDHATNFPLKHAHKDMKLACEMAKEAGVEYSVMDRAEQLFREAREDKDLNISEDDFSAVYEKIHKESNGEASKKR